MSDFLKSVIKEVGNEYASLVIDGVEAGDVDSFIDTGSYIFNGLLSGSLYGGLASNKITALAGESATGKTYFLMGIVKNFLDKDPNAGVIYFESEFLLLFSFFRYSQNHILVKMLFAWSFITFLPSIIFKIQKN